VDVRVAGRVLGDDDRVVGVARRRRWRRIEDKLRRGAGQVVGADRCSQDEVAALVRARVRDRLSGELGRGVGGDRAGHGTVRLGAGPPTIISRPCTEPVPAQWPLADVHPAPAARDMTHSDATSDPTQRVRVDLTDQAVASP
jgi:hypothetical protein